MTEIVIILACVALVLWCIVSMNYLSRIDDWLFDIYDEQLTIVGQYNHIIEKLDEMSEEDLDGIEFVEIRKRSK